MEDQVIKQENKIFVLNAKNEALIAFLEEVKLTTKVIVYNAYNNTWVLPARYAIPVRNLGFHIIDNPSTPEKDRITVRLTYCLRRDTEMIRFDCPVTLGLEQHNTLQLQLHSQKVNNMHYVHKQYVLQAYAYLRRNFNIEFQDDKAKSFVETLIQEKADREKVENLNFNKIDWSQIAHFNGTLKDFQEKNQTKLLNAGLVTSKKHRTIDFSGVGIGKSVQSIAYGLYLKQQGLIKYMIIVVPGALRNEFSDEISKFVSGLSYEKIEGYDHELNPDAFFKVISYALFCELKRKNSQKPSIAERLLAPIAKDSLIVFDESQKLGNKDAGSTNNAINLCNGLFEDGNGNNYPPAFAVRIMTGTPFGTGITKLWSQLLVLGIDNEIAPNFTIFKRTYSQGKIIGQAKNKKGVLVDIYKETGARNLPELYDRLSYCSIRVLIKDVIDNLPTMTRKIIHVDLAPKDRKSYDEAEDNIIQWIAENIDTPAAWRARKNEAAIKAGKLNQISANAKVPATAELIKILLESEETFVCFCSYREPLIMLSKMFPELSLAISGSKKSAVDDFKKGKTKGLLISTAKGNYGLNLQYASRVIIFIDQPATPDKKTQAEGRVYRTGQNKAVIIYNMLASHTLDKKRCQIIDSRQTDIDIFFGEAHQKLVGKTIDDDQDIQDSIAIEVLKARYEERKKAG